jgi:hypothetical protein
MSQSIQTDLHRFAATLLERRGGLVDWPAPEQRGTALLTSEMADALHVDEETLDLSCQAGGNGLCVSLASDFLEKTEYLLRAEPRVGSFLVKDLYLKRGQVDEAVERAFTWLNAKVRLGETHESRQVYHTWWFHAVLASEDRWESYFPITINTLTGARVEIPDALDLWELEPGEEGQQPLAPTYRSAVRQAQREMKTMSSKFLDRMDARIERDRKRLRDYYRALLKETNEKQQRGTTKTDPAKAAEKKHVVKLELERKLLELDGRYAIEARLTPIMLVMLDLPTLEVELVVHRKKAKKMHTLIWNPLLKRFEPLACERCGRSIYSIAFSNDDVLPHCDACVS